MGSLLSACLCQSVIVVVFFQFPNWETLSTCLDVALTSGGLSEQGQPVDILRVLQSLELDTCTVPDTIMKGNVTGNTFATSWLARRLTKLKVGLSQ